MTSYIFLPLSFHESPSAYAVVFLTISNSFILVSTSFSSSQFAPLTFTTKLASYSNLFNNVQFFHSSSFFSIFSACFFTFGSNLVSSSLLFQLSIYFSSSYCYFSHLPAFTLQFQSFCCRLPNEFQFFNSSLHLFHRLNFLLSTPANLLSMFSGCFFTVGSNPFSRSPVAIFLHFFIFLFLPSTSSYNYAPISVFNPLLSFHELQIILFFFSSYYCYL